MSDPIQENVFHLNGKDYIELNKLLKLLNLVSTGGGHPWKVRCRPPCWPIVSSIAQLIEGHMLADIVPTFGSVNMIGGECDR